MAAPGCPPKPSTLAPPFPSRLSSVALSQPPAETPVDASSPSYQNPAVIAVKSAIQGQIVTITAGFRRPFTVHDAYAAGMTPSSLRWQVRRGVIQRIEPVVYLDGADVPDRP